MLKDTFCGTLRLEMVGRPVRLAGWVKDLRNLGGLIFIALRDSSGLAQVSIDPAKLKVGNELGLEDVISVTGTVRERPKEAKNPKMETGDVEVIADEVGILNKSKVPPFVVENEVKASEELRLKYRYLDLRRPVVAEPIKLRHKVTQAVREYLNALGFFEIATPFLARATPEGARDYLVPARNWPGKFYALPQSPQLYKQILMVAGFEKYYQIACCLRDEDLRADRQPEFHQIDIEMSFIEEEDILQLTENMMRSVFKTTLGVDLPQPFPRIGYEECIERYGIDKPDLRFALEIQNLEPHLRASSFAPFQDRPAIRGLIAKHAETVSRSEIERFPELFWTKKKGELTGGIAKYISPEMAGQLGLEDGDLLLVKAGPKEQVLKQLGEIRLYLADRLKLRQSGYEFLWVRDFPLFEYSETDKQIQPAHHIFTMIHERDIGILDKEPLKAFSYHYDLVLNGWEVASGSIRVHNRALQEKLLSIVGIDPAEASRRYGFLLDALEYGAPPHGGIAVGYDRLLAIMAGRDSIRDVIAFPKTTQAQGLMEGTPSEVPEQDLKVLRIRLDKKD